MFKFFWFDFIIYRLLPSSTLTATLFPYRTLFRSERLKESWIDYFKWCVRHDLIKPDVVKLATSANGAVVLTNLLKRGFPADFVPPELVETVPSFAEKLAKLGPRKKKNYAPPPVSSAGETFSDSVLRIVQSYNGKGQTVDADRKSTRLNSSH